MFFTKKRIINIFYTITHVQSGRKRIVAIVTISRFRIMNVRLTGINDNDIAIQSGQLSVPPRFKFLLIRRNTSVLSFQVLPNSSKPANRT